MPKKHPLSKSKAKSQPRPPPPHHAPKVKQKPTQAPIPAPRSTNRRPATASTSTCTQGETLQEILDVFTTTFFSDSTDASLPCLDTTTLAELVKDIKRSLYERDFTGAFDVARDAGPVAKKSSDLHQEMELETRNLPRFDSLEVCPQMTATKHLTTVVNSKHDRTTFEHDAAPETEQQKFSSVKASPLPFDLASVPGDCERTINTQRLMAYSARWSAARAMAYWDLFTTLDLRAHILDKAFAHDTRRIICFGGGGGAETVALATLLHRHYPLPAQPLAVDITVVDVAEWSGVNAALATSLQRRYGDRGARLRYDCICADALDTKTLARLIRTTDESACTVSSTEAPPATPPAPSSCPDKPPSMMRTPTIHKPVLITLMFTLNELFTTSRSQTIRFLLTLTDLLAPEALLLVVDSPGSYSAVALTSDTDTQHKDQTQTQTQKHYPMQWLLDHTLLTTAREQRPGSTRERPCWDKVDGCDSRWFRSGGIELQYALELQDMRYQMHLYRRL